MNKKTVRDIKIEGKKVIHHCDFNIKLQEDEAGKLAPISDMRLKAYFPSIFYLLEKNCKIIFISWLERPGGKVVKKLSLAPVAARLSRLINKQVYFLDDCVGPKVKKFISQMKPGQMVMLENTRFHQGEETDQDSFSRQLAANGDLMIQDALGHCHRIHASVTGIPRHLTSVIGPYLEKEINILDSLDKKSQSPLVLVIGGVKVADKMPAMKKLIPQTDYVLTNDFWAKVLKPSRKIIMPVDAITANGQNLDIGPKTIKKYLPVIKKAKTIFWSGPLGQYEDEQFANGTRQIAQAISENQRTTILAGGDTAAAAEKFDLVFKYTHVSIAGGATLEYLAGNQLPGLEALTNL